MTDQPHMAGRDGGDLVPVWDGFVRFYHWAQAALIAVCWLTSDDLKTVHQAAGLSIAALLALRIIWGLIGPGPARFTAFLHGPRAVLSYLAALRRGTEPRHLGHNPAGGVMVIALMLAVGATAFSGWLQTTDAFWGSDLMEDGHEALATLILGLVGLHLAGVALASLRHRENLVRAMLDGRKRPLDPPTAAKD